MAVEGTLPPPPPPTSTDKLILFSITNKKKPRLLIRNGVNLMISSRHGSLDPYMTLQEQDVTTPGNAKALWDHLQNLFHDNTDARAINLDNELRSIKIGKMTINEYCTNVKSKADRLKNLGYVGRIEVVDSDGHMRSCPSDLRGVAGGRGTRSSIRLAGSRRIRVGSWNETKWKGSIAREGNGYKLWYSGSSTARNGVGIILIGRLKDNVVRVTRRSDRIMAISVIIEGETVNVISAYAPQVGLSDADKKRFWDALYDLVRECLADQRLIIRGDLNGHISAAVDGYAGFTEVLGLEIGMKKGSGGHNTQIDYLLVCRGDLKACKDCRAFLVETFRATVSDKLAMEDMSASNTNQMWNTLARVMKDAAKDSLATKQSRFKELLSCREDNQEDIDRAKERYNAAKREARIAVDKVKDKAYEDLYKKLDSKDGVNDIYKIAKARERRRRDIGNMRYIKDEGDEGRKTEMVWACKEETTNCLGWRVEALVVEGSRRRGRPKLRWEDRLKMDMKELCLSKEMTSDRNAWRDRIRING
nr:hypothetical protein [Tanacetum cinerariifolium]